MRSLTEEQLQFLRRFGFDEGLFRSWRKAVKDGSLSLHHNAVASEIHAPAPGSIDELPKKGQAFTELEQLGAAAIARGELGVVVLNGGMATRFGGVVKGVVEVLGPGRSFLGLKAEDLAQSQQRHGGHIRLSLMNSFATEEATLRHLRENDWFGLDPAQVVAFNQFVSVRMEKNGDIFQTKDGQISPYGPGHGDFAGAFRESCLRAFLHEGGKYLFVCNVDNLGARIHPAILGHHIRRGVEMTVEVAPKWPGDVGGSPFVVDDRLQLIEQIRYPEGFDPDIVDVFNTNTFHFTAASLDRDFELGRYYVQKKVDGRTAVQIEHLIGELTRFLTTSFLRVKRTGVENRFFPIKTPEDLESGHEEIAELYPKPEPPA